jgi:hypothetical protein
MSNTKRARDTRHFVFFRKEICRGGGGAEAVNQDYSENWF